MVRSVAPALVRQRGKLRYKAKHRLIIFDNVEYYHLQIDIPNTCHHRPWYLSRERR